MLNHRKDIVKVRVAVLVDVALTEPSCSYGASEAGPPFAEQRELSDLDLANAIEQTVPLYDTYEDRIKELRDWARGRTRSASLDVRMADLFSQR